MLRSWPIALLCFTIVPADIAAQYDATHPVAVLAGYSVAVGQSASGRGLQLGGRVILPATAWLGVRFDVGYMYFAGGTYIIDYVDGSSATQQASLKVLSASASVTVLDPPSVKRRISWIAGLGLYHVNDSQDGSRYTSPGWNAGMCIPISKSVSLDLRYHGLIRPTGTQGFVPISLGVRLL